MPCRSDYLEPSTYEQSIKEVVDLIVYVEEKLSLPADVLAKKSVETKNIYFDQKEGDYFVRTLCGYMRNRTEAEKKVLLTTSLHDPTSFALGKWWA